MNQPLSVQSWGKDGDKRTYWLVEGQDDTSFRVYRESERYKKTNYHWRSVAGTIDEVKALATKLETDDTTQNARRLAQRITNAVPRFEATEEVSIDTSVFKTPLQVLTILHRKSDVASTVRFAALHSPDMNRASLFTKDEHAVKGCGTPLRKMKTSVKTQMQHPLVARTGSRAAVRPLRSVRRSQLVADRFGPEAAACMASLYSAARS